MCGSVRVRWLTRRSDPCRQRVSCKLSLRKGELTRRVVSLSLARPGATEGEDIKEGAHQKPKMS